MPTAINLPVVLVIEMDEVDEQLGALSAAEAWRMPGLVQLGPVGCDEQVAEIDGFRTLTASLEKNKKQ